MSEIPVSTSYTHDFVRAALPEGARRLLEVGCGDGALAERLKADGFEIVALDSNPACAEAARARGVDARKAEWPVDLDRQFDAILFTRSLHHIHALDEAVAAAERTLRPGGRLIVEDFRAEGGTARTSDWYRAMVRQLLSGGMLVDGVDAEELIAMLPPARHAGHDLHSSTAIAAALDPRCEVSAAGAAYHFRYLEPWLRDQGAAQWLLDVELEQIASGDIDALGQRFVAVPR